MDETDPLWTMMETAELQRFFLKGVYGQAVRVSDPVEDFLKKWQYNARLFVTATDVFKSGCFRSIDDAWMKDYDEYDEYTIGIKALKRGRALWLIDPLFPQAVLASDLKVIEMCSWKEKQ